MNIIALTGQNITYQNIFDAVLLYIKQHCKNIGTIKNDIPVHFDKTHRFIYSLGFKNGNDKPLILGSYCLTLNYDKDKNKRLAIVKENTVRKNLETMFNINNINRNTNVVQFNDLLRIILIILKFYSKKILRVYFPLTNNYAYFYDGLSTENENLSYLVQRIDIKSENGIKQYINEFYKLLIGTDTYNKSANTITDLFYSLLYKITVNTVKVDKYKMSYIDPDGSNDTNETALAKLTEQINIT